jgi:hypothetical protein
LYGLPKKVFDDLQAQLAANRAQFYCDLAAGPFHGFKRSGASETSARVVKTQALDKRAFQYERTKVCPPWGQKFVHLKFCIAISEPQSDAQHPDKQAEAILMEAWHVICLRTETLQC